MEHSVPALIIAAIMIIGGVLIADVTRHSVSTVNESWREIEAISEERLGTHLTVVSAEADEGGAEVTAVVRNDGRTSIDDFERMDLIVNYDGEDSTRHNRWLPYTQAEEQPANTWTVTEIINDFRNPGILDTGEEMTIRIMLSPAADESPERWLVLATTTGIAYTVYF